MVSVSRPKSEQIQFTPVGGWCGGVAHLAANLPYLVPGGSEIPNTHKHSEIFSQTPRECIRCPWGNQDSDEIYRVLLLFTSISGFGMQYNRHTLLCEDEIHILFILLQTVSTKFRYQLVIQLFFSRFRS